MSEKIINFPLNSESEEESIRRKDQERYEQLSVELEVLDKKIEEMMDLVGGSRTDIGDDANDQISQLKVDLMEMRERKFYSPIKRRETLDKLKKLRIIFRTSNQLLDDYYEKEDEFLELAKKLGELDNVDNED